MRWYSLIVLAAIFTGVWLTAREAERKGFKKSDIYDGALWGGVAGGLIAILAMRPGWQFPRLLDATAPGLVLAHDGTVDGRDRARHRREVQARRH